MRGASLVELIFALAVSSALALSGALLLSTSSRFAVRSYQHAERHHALLRLESMLRYAIEGLDSHRLDLAPRIHTAGWIRFTDGSLSPVMSGSRRPHATSDALSAAWLLSADSLEVRAVSASAISAYAAACAKYKDSISLAAVRSMVALSVEGLQELKLRSALPNGTPGCYALNLERSKSMLVPECSECGLGNIHALIPVQEIFTLYHDRQSQLRYLSHSGDEILENQPLVLGPKLRKIELNLSTAYALHFLAVRTEFEDTLPALASFHNTLAREAHYNLLLN